MRKDAFVASLAVGRERFAVASLAGAGKAGLADVARLPFSIRILLEGVLRRHALGLATDGDVEAIARWRPDRPSGREIPFLPSRVLLQDFTGIPLLCDLAALREAAESLGADPARVNPVLPVDLVIDHSVQVDAFGSPGALEKNLALEYERNAERYAFLRWGQKAFRNLRVLAPGLGICHQVNLERLATVVSTREEGERLWAFPDTLVGTDSHTPMVNGLGVLGWGVGGIEAEAAMLGIPQGLKVPEVVGVRLSGALPAGVTATDAVLAITERLRKAGVVEKFVEYFGPGVPTLTVPDRATLSNMSPEYGATVGFFPVDERTLAYLRLTGRDESLVGLVEAYAKAQGLWLDPAAPAPSYSSVVEFDLASVEPCLAGPKRPQDRVPLSRAPAAFREALAAPVAKRGFGLAAGALAKAAETPALGHGAVVLAAITSCTNTSNPALMLGAGILARNAVARGLRRTPHVKTSLAPGSRAVTEYLAAAGLLPPLEALGFHVVGYGCTTCIGNSGPLPSPVEEAILAGKPVVASVLSGNRNFEGRIHPLVPANYLASPLLVVAYALAGRIDFDFEREPLGRDGGGRPVLLRDLWPTAEEIAAALASVRPEAFARAAAADDDERWRRLAAPAGARFAWDPASAYIRRPPFLDGVRADVPQSPGLRGARVLALLGDSVTTDHISPAGAIDAAGPAGRHLLSLGVAKKDFNAFGARRGNHEVMARGTFANVRLKNLLVPGVEGGVTAHQPTGETMPVFEAAERYRAEKVPLIVVAGKEYGSGSSRDWAAKGPALLGVRAVLAESYERIHRANLVGMGILPLELPPGQSAASLGIAGREAFDIDVPEGGIPPRDEIPVRARRPDGSIREFRAIARLDTPLEAEVHRHGGILPWVLRRLAGAPAARGR